MLSVLLARWFVTLPLLGLTAVLAVVGYLHTPLLYESGGTVLVARPEVDPSRAAAASIDVRELVEASGTQRFNDDVVAAGGFESFAVVAVSDTRLQVLATGESAVITVGRVLQRLADELASRQAGRGIPREERIRARLILQAPENGQSAGLGLPTAHGGQREIVGTFLLQDFSLDVANPFGNPATASRLLLIEVRSDDGRARLSEQLGQDVEASVNLFDPRARDLLWITTTGPDSAAVLSSFEQVVDLLDEELDRRQALAGVPPNARLIIDILAAPLETSEQRPGARRLASAIALAGGLLTAAAGVFPVPRRLPDATAPRVNEHP